MSLNSELIDSVIERSKSQVVPKPVIPGLENKEFTNKGFLYARSKNLKQNCYVINKEIFPEKIEEIREFVIKNYEKAGYVGFDRKIDKQFDKDSVSFYVENEKEEIKATQRLTFKTTNNLVPIEIGERIDGTGFYNLNKFKSLVDLNSLAFNNFRYLGILYYSSMDYLINIKTEFALGLVDNKNESMIKFYNSIFAESYDEFDVSIKFANYGVIDKSSFKQTVWNIICADVSILTKIKNKFINLIINNL